MKRSRPGYRSLVVPSVMLFFLANAVMARAEVTLPAVIGDHMVLQRGMPITIWGWASPGEDVTVALGELKATAKTDAEGKWMVKLPELQAAGQILEMTISGKNTIKLSDILVGEVWFGSGQSNMQWSVRQSVNAAEEIAAAKYSQIRIFSVPLVPAGKPAKTVNASWKVCSPETVPDFSAVSYFFGREIHKALGLPVGMIGTSWGGTRIEPWIPPSGFASQPDLQKERDEIHALQTGYQNALKAKVEESKAWVAAAEKAAAAGQELPDPPAMPGQPFNSNNVSTGLYNGMIHPLVPFAVRGALWYQGESNRGQGMHYHSLMKGLIQGWRDVWGQGDFPFLYVQLAPYVYDTNVTALPEIWEAQMATLAFPNTGMAVTTDISTVRDIHPPNKQEVGRRLALWALAKTYGKSDVVYSGPHYESMSVDLDQAKVKFKYAGGLKSRDGKPLTWFSIAGADKRFLPATATIEGEVVVVKSPQVTTPVAVRFGWHQAAEPNLANQAGLPAVPFRTDTWSDAVPAAPEQ
ncbi:MAG TPA: sialate O-acetylesterase [Pirellulales bacterium]|nr:sialate O-acetylesterase [Pirellulales bacterium]